MSVATLIGTGMTMGIVHVLTGPDHLSALATLSSNTDDFQAFWYGIRWGIGHSIGLVFVGSIMIVISYHGNKNKNDGGDGDDGIDMPEGVEYIFESFVGVFMLLLGMYGYISARKERRRKMEDMEELTRMTVERTNDDDGHMYADQDEHDNDEFLEDGNGNGNRTPRDPSTSQSHLMIDSTHIHNHDSIHLHHEHKTRYQDNTTETFVEDHHHHSHDHDHHHHHHHHHIQLLSSTSSCLLNLLCPLPTCKLAYSKLTECKCSKYVLSLGIGIVHGAAGPGGVLGIIPAVELHDWRLAMVYLGTFCVTSTLVMGSYAGLYGYVSACIVRREKGGRGGDDGGGGVADVGGVEFEFRMAAFSSFLSIFVGLMWLILIALGKLHDFFP